MSPRDSDRQKVYDAESLAFRNTPLDDLVQEHTLHNVYAEATNSSWWQGERPTVIPARADMTKWGGFVRGEKIHTSAGRVQRSTASHELAHVLVRREHSYVASHGFEFRTAHVRTVSAIFGQQYGDLLAETYSAFGLSYEYTTTTNPPVIDIDGLSIATDPVGGWKRKTA